MGGQAESAYSQSSGGGQNIDELITEHLPLVRHIVSQLPPDYVHGPNEEDLLSAGTLGLVEAAHRFREDRGVKFATFAYHRIKGAVVDYLRENDFLSKSARARLRDVRRRIMEFQGENGRKPTIEELAKLSEISEDAVVECLDYEKWDSVASLAGGLEDEEGDETALAAILPDSIGTPLDQVVHNERVERLAGAIEDLSEREKQVIVMYYFEELYMSEMAEILKVTESRVSQIHSRALYNLSRKMEGV